MIGSFANCKPRFALLLIRYTNHPISRSILFESLLLVSTTIGRIVRMMDVLSAYSSLMTHLSSWYPELQCSPL